MNDEVTTLGAILRMLYRLRRGDEEIRPVLNDALLERYPLYLELVEESEKPALERTVLRGNPWGRQYVVVDPKALIRFDQGRTKDWPFAIFDETQMLFWGPLERLAPGVAGWRRAIPTYVSRRVDKSSYYTFTVFGGREPRTVRPTWRTRREAEQFARFYRTRRPRHVIVVHRVDEEPKPPRRF